MFERHHHHLFVFILTIRVIYSAGIQHHHLVPKERFIRQVTSLLVTPSQCTFGSGRELATCGWNLTTSNSSIIGSSRFNGLEWLLSSGRAAFFRGGPSSDASGEPEGGYLLVETSQIGDSALLPSPLLNSTRPEGRCIVFQYSMDGPSADRLRLVLQQSQTVVHQMVNDTFVLVPRREILWEARDGTGDLWQTAAVLYGHGHQHQLMFEAVAEEWNPNQKRLRGHIALDNVDLGTWIDLENNDVNNQGNLLSNPCLGHCNFDGGFCGWSNEQQDDDFDWRLGRGSVNGATGPSRDHSNNGPGSPSRGYAFIDSSYPRVPGDRARLLSPLMEATDPDKPLCFKFWTHLYGNGIGTLKVVLLPGSIETESTTPTASREVWSLTGEAGNFWHQGQLSLSAPTPFRIAFDAITGRNHLGDIAIDDISFSLGSCPGAPQAAVRHQGDCNFENDECGWINAGTRESVDDIDWMRVPAENSRQPPLKDHSTSTGKGFVMSPIRSAVQRPGDRAWLLSRPFNVTPGWIDQRCLTFWYFMNEPIIDPAGPSLGSLRIYTRKEDPFVSMMMMTASTVQPNVIWRLQNHQGGNWKLGRAQIEQTSSYRVVIEGMWGSSRSNGAVAIDDISFYEGPCRTSPQEAEPVAAECSFDRDTCGWRNNGTGNRPDGLEWRLATASRRPANLPDHTFGAPSGYVYFDIFSQTSKLEMVRLIGPNMSFGGSDDSRSICLNFWFAAFGAGDSTQLKIMVLIDNLIGSEQGTEIWALKVGQLDRSSDWNFGQVEMESSGGEAATSMNINIIFEGRASNGGFAVDDINFQRGSCKTRPTFAVPTLS